jgi:hypothetical protein
LQQTIDGSGEDHHDLSTPNNRKTQSFPETVIMDTIVSPMTQAQIELVECALRVLMKISPVAWAEIPADLQRCFERYMERDVWTGEPDFQTFRQAAVMILRDAISRHGEFARQGA